MSDSDIEFSNSVFTLRNENTIISARGPNTCANNITGISFQRPRIFERQRYAESNCDQQSMLHRRETSPMSVMSACDMRQRNLFHPRGISSQRSVFNGRSGSPMSQRSMDSSASVTAADIATAFKSTHFNKYDLRLIKDAYNKFMKHRIRRKIEKRRNLKLFLKGRRRKSGGDSGEQGSDSSLSSDDRSTRTFNHKENMSSNRSTKTDISELRRTIRECNMYKDCTDSFRYHSAQSETSGPTQTSLGSCRSMTVRSNLSSYRSMPMRVNFNNMRSNLTNAVPQKDRFTSGFLLPSQRFNRSIASTAILENTAKVDNHSTRNNFQNQINTKEHSEKNIETDSDDIFSAATSKQKTNNNSQRKRCIDSDDDICLPYQKRTKIVSPCKNSIEARKPMPKGTNSNMNNNVANDFVFAKPSFPVRKHLKEKLTSKSAGPISDTYMQASMMPPASIEQLQAEKPVEQEKYEDGEPSNTTQNVIDISMRPSFIKRKLFTQKLDMSEKRNLSTDSLNSPQNSIYGAIQKEKHKARKLQQATSQSCLSRDIQQDESNLLDLIHKIVPLEQMNVTNQTNKTDIQNNNNKSNENGDIWDVTSIISTQNHDEEGSDTYTDEEIFNATMRELTKDISNKQSPLKGKKVLAKENALKKPSPMKAKGCNVLVEKLPANYLEQHKNTNEFIDRVTNKSVQKCIKSFWDTDFESDAEYHPPPKIDRINFEENQQKGTLHPKEATKVQGFSSIFNSKKPAAASISNASIYLNNTDNVYKFNTTSLRIRTHRAPKRKKLHQTMDEDVISEPPCVKQKTFQSSSCLELNKANPDLQNVKCKETGVKQISKQNNKKSPKIKKLTPKINKCNEPTDSVKEIPSKKQINKRLKINQTKIKLPNNQQETVQCKQQSKSECAINLKENKQVIDSQKSSASKQKANSRKQNLVDSESQNKKQSNTSDKKDQLVLEDSKKDKHTNTNKKTAETKIQIKKQTPKSKNTKKTVQNNSFLNDEPVMEENNNSFRAVRLCRIRKQNETFDKSNLELNGTIIRTLRSREIALSTTLNGNIAKAKQKVDNRTKHAESRLSNVSFSLASDKNIAKRDVTKMINSLRYKAKDVESSDVSFSLTINESPTPKKAISGKSRVSSRAGKNQKSLTKSIPVKQNAVQSKKILISNDESRSSRNRIPNKKYLMC